MVYRISSSAIIYLPLLVDTNREWNHSFADTKPCCPSGRPNAFAVARFKQAAVLLSLRSGPK